LSFLESVPDVSAKLKTPNTADEKFSDVVQSAQDAAVLVWFIKIRVSSVAKILPLKFSFCPRRFALSIPRHVARLRS